MKTEIQKFFKGEIFDDEKTLETYSKDASLFRVRPKLVVFPEDKADLENLVQWVKREKHNDPSLSLTIRSAGSCMAGGPLNESIIVDVTRHLNKIGKVEGKEVVVEPGAFYRDFEKKTLEKELILPCYTASKNLAALGGMIGNNCGGEKSLRYGKMENYLSKAKWVFSDGHEYEVKPLNKAELEGKINQGDFEGSIYKQISELIQNNESLIKEAKPNVSKNSAGYYLWNVCQGENFDLNRLLVGSQGTLGLLTEAQVSLVPVEKASKLFVIFLHDLSKLSEIVNLILPTKPDSIESYDDATMKLAFRFFPEMMRTMKIKHFLSLILSFIPEAWMVFKGGMPKLVLLVEYSGSNTGEVDQKMNNLEKIIDPLHIISRKTISEEESEKYWTVRRESFNLLRKHVHGRHTAPFVDDVVVKPSDMPEFLPKMRKILDSYHLTYTIAGHAGNGNFHIIPLMDMKDQKNISVIREVSEKVYDLVNEYGGSITGEHNDGIVRTPYLNKMYKPEVLELFKKVKEIFDPENIFNPGKKVGGSLEYFDKHLDIEKL